MIATRSAGKLRELRPMFSAAGLSVADLAELGISESAEEELLERYETFEENALAKARYFHRRIGMPVVADDSGLEVDGLGGRPGVRSKRWSGRTDLSGRDLDEANNALLLQSLRGVAERRARYVCVAAYVAGTRELTRRGEALGVIVDEPRGAGGFGYDPYFVAAGTGRTFAELSVSEKEELSHRGRAFGALIRAIAGVG
ncbi:MAG: RdgB/HAM1 family non-canonical purine NTP pyrophosphatase [Gemmatimonadaceae bacterium]